MLDFFARYDAAAGQVGVRDRGNIRHCKLQVAAHLPLLARRHAAPFKLKSQHRTSLKSRRTIANRSLSFMTHFATVADSGHLATTVAREFCSRGQTSASRASGWFTHSTPSLNSAVIRRPALLTATLKCLLVKTFVPELADEGAEPIHAESQRCKNFAAAYRSLDCQPKSMQHCSLT